MTMRLSNDYWNEAKSQRGLTGRREKSDMGWNDIDMKEAREIIRNDSYFTRQRDALEEAGGRFAKLTPSTVTGQSPSSQFPAIPSGPWAAPEPTAPDPATNEFGVAIDEQEAVGSPQEIERSLPASSADQSIGSPGDVGTESPPSEGIAVGLSTNSAKRKSFRRRF
jgi:hypothetical protein